MINTIKVSKVSMIVVLILTFVFMSNAYAGSVTDSGQLTGLPTQANYIAWVPLFTPPHQIVTEDSVNTQSGVNQGYQNLIWVLQPSNMNNPVPINGLFINMIFGGLGADNGTLWTYNFLWSDANPNTNHSVVGTQSSGTCPTMLQGLQDGTKKTINWSGPSSQYLIFRSILPSGAGNGASDGRYDYVATIPADTFTYLDTACPTGTDCWHIVVPANGSGVPNGCHSEESNPTAITLSAFSASGRSMNPWMFLIGISAMAGLLIVTMIIRRLKPTPHS